MAQDPIEKLEAAVKKLTSDMSEVRDDITDMQGDITEIRGDITKLQKSQDEVLGYVKGIQKTQTALTNAMTQAIKQLGTDKSIEIRVRRLEDAVFGTKRH